MNEPIYITIPPKYVSLVAPVVAEPASVKIKSEMKPLAIRPPSAGSDDEYSSMDEYVGGGSPRGKKRRLDHLTWEEKVQRKKLKNRVAAQTSRDRKKAKMEEMEQTIQEQADQIGELQHRCTALDAEKTAIFDKYLELERRFDELQQRLVAQESNQSAKNGSKKLVEQVDGGSVGCVTAGRQTGSAASFRCPQQQGLKNGVPAEAQTTLPPTTKSDERLTALWKIIAICLLYRTCSKISTLPSSRSLPKACSQVSAPTWRALIAQAARLMPKATAPDSACLDQWWGPQQNSWNPVDRTASPLIREAV